MRIKRNNLATCPFTGQVLAVVDGGEGGIWVQVFTSSGAPTTERIRISDEAAYCGWSLVAAAQDKPQTWAVSYLMAIGNNPRVLRVVTPTSVSRAFPVAEVTTEWNYSERGGLAWTPQGWVVSIRLPGPTCAYPALVRVRFDGTTDAPVALAGQDDGRNAGALAYSAGFLCAVGFSSGLPDYHGGTWGRVVKASETLEPIGTVLALDTHARCEDHAITVARDVFVAQWTRNNQSTTTRISTEGAFTPPVVMPTEGAYAVAYNAGADTILLAMKDAASDLTARQLTAGGELINVADDLRLAVWDGRVPDYHPSITAIPGGWMVSADFGDGSRLFVVRGALGASLKSLNTPAPKDAPPPPPPPPPPTRPQIIDILASTHAGTAPLSVQFQAVTDTPLSVPTIWIRKLTSSTHWMRCSDERFTSYERPIFDFDAGDWEVTAVQDETLWVPAHRVRIKVAVPPPPPPPPPARTSRWQPWIDLLKEWSQRRKS